MKNSVFSIIFDYRGKINNREFLYGIVTLLFLTSILCNFEVLKQLQLYSLQKFDSYHDINKWYEIKYFLFGFIPTVPFNVVLLYSSIVLAVKRIRTTESGTAFSILIGIFFFLGFRSMVSFADSINTLKLYRIEPHPLLWLLIISSFLGFISIAILSFKNSYDDRFIESKEKRVYSFSFHGEMTDLNYISHLTRMYFWTFLAFLIYAVLLIAVILVSKNNYDTVDSFSKLFSFCLIIFFLTMCVFYFNISVQRVRGIGYKGMWVPISLFLVAAMMLTGIYLYNNTEEPIVAVLLVYLLFFLSKLFWLLQFLLIITPNDMKKKLRNFSNRLKTSY